MSQPLNWDTVSESVHTQLGRVAELPHWARQHIEQYVHQLSAALAHSVADDFYNFKVNAVTVTISITTLVAFAISTRFFKAAPAPLPPKKPLTMAQKTNLEIKRVLDFVEDEYVPQIDKYIEKYDKLDEGDREYKFNYFQEMLLKQLLALDGIDVGGNVVLRDNRRKVINFIQEHQSRLDTFKKSQA